jgi:hypothetical protein
MAGKFCAVRGFVMMHDVPTEKPLGQMAGE